MLRAKRVILSTLHTGLHYDRHRHYDPVSPSVHPFRARILIQIVRFILPDYVRMHSSPIVPYSRLQRIGYRTRTAAQHALAYPGGEAPRTGASGGGRRRGRHRWCRGLVSTASPGVLRVCA
jgi:hypothetical protein